MIKKITTLLLLSMVIQVYAGDNPIKITTVGGDGFCKYDNIQKAIDSEINWDIIRIASNKNYFESIEVNNRSLDLVGGFANCYKAFSNTSDFSQAIITGNWIDSVIEINPDTNETHDVLLQNLFIANGKYGVDAAPVNKVSGLNVTLDNVRIFNTNLAGVNVVSPSRGRGNGQSKVVINDSQIDFNEGNGLRCKGKTSYVKVAGQTSFDSNDQRAIYAQDECQIDIYSPTKITNNRHGALSAYSGTNVLIMGFREDCEDGICFGEWDAPVEISGNGNEATFFSGAILANNSVVQIYNALIENNQARLGAALLASFDGTIIATHYSGETKDCWAPGACLQIKNNLAVVQGGAMRAVIGGKIEVIGAHISGNSSPQGIVSYADTGGEVNITSSIISNNYSIESEGLLSDKALFSVKGPQEEEQEKYGFGKIILNHVTVVDNQVESVFHNNGGIVNADSSIIFDENDLYKQTEMTSYSYFQCLMVREEESLNADSSTSVVDAPLDNVFANPAQGDYHLKENSPAIDYCYNASGKNSRDIDYELRGVDNPDVINFLGTYDIGADEFDFEVINGET